MVGALVAVGALSGCGAGTQGDHREKNVAGKVLVAFRVTSLPNHDGLVAAIQERPALRGLVVHQVELPLLTEGSINKAMQAAIEKYNADIFYTYTPISFSELMALNAKKKPVVFLTVIDLQKMGFADKSGKRPPGYEHVTGLSVYAPTHVKHIEVIRNAFPRTRRIGVMVDEFFDTPAVMDAMRGQSGVEPVLVRTKRAESVDDVFARIAAARADAWYFPQTAYLQDNYKALIPKLRAARVRGLYGWHFGAMNGGTLAMQPAIPDRDKRSAEQIELVLTGTPPAQIAIETATTLRLSGNVEALRELGDDFDTRVLRYMDIFF